MSILFNTPVFLFPNFFSFVQKSYKLRCYKRISCPEKFFNKTREKIPYFIPRVFVIANQQLTRHSPCAPLGQVR